MGFLRVILLCFACILSVAADSSIIAGYAPGVSGIPFINETCCTADEILQNANLSSSLECARTCTEDEPPKTCYYKFIVERYSANNQACGLCTSNFTNALCPNCQCVSINGLERMVLTVNRMIPGPTIQVCQGDFIVVDVLNKIDSEALSIHWHGVFQKDFQYYDGVPFVTQCPISSGNTFRYQFPALNSGTHFWHAHTGLHKMDGVTGTLVIRAPEEDEPNADLYDFDLANHVIHLSDWMNEESTGRFPGRNTGVVRQLPESLLINGKGQYRNSTGTYGSMEVITVDPNQRYRFRIINSFCTICSGLLTIEGHNLTLIATDGESVEPVVVDSIVSFAGERYDFVINTDQPSGNYWIQLRGQGDCTNNSIYALAILHYSDAFSAPSMSAPTYSSPLDQGVTVNAQQCDCTSSCSDDICISQLKSATSVDKAISQPIPDYKFYLPIGSVPYSVKDIFEPNTYKKFLVPAPYVPLTMKIANISFESPSSPILSQLEDVPTSQICNLTNLPSDCTDDVCSCTHVISVPLNSVVEIAMVDEFGTPGLAHPFHLHGYAFSVVSMGQPLGPMTRIFGSNMMSIKLLQELEANNTITKNLDNPVGKDTLAIPNNGYAIFRIHATNPGYWFFHCHFVYHLMSGMSVIINVGEQSDLPSVPDGFPKCGNFLPNIYEG
ncbi:uncharacterized protein LOC143180212 [Calliopsis andreniformis]|uniref:uncharacterized protein LOC143180212 n=1 Tax=Calliopsis andreniformis TaxID=337506 RepID=UPI003FCE08AB